MKRLFALILTLMLFVLPFASAKTMPESFVKSYNTAVKTVVPGMIETLEMDTSKSDDLCTYVTLTVTSKDGKTLRVSNPTDDVTLIFSEKAVTLRLNCGRDDVLEDEKMQLLPITTFCYAMLQLDPKCSSVDMFEWLQELKDGSSFISNRFTLDYEKNEKTVTVTAEITEEEKDASDAETVVNDDPELQVDEDAPLELGKDEYVQIDGTEEPAVSE